MAAAAASGNMARRNRVVLLRKKRYGVNMDHSAAKTRWRVSAARVTHAFAGLGRNICAGLRISEHRSGCGRYHSSSIAFCAWRLREYRLQSRFGAARRRGRQMEKCRDIKRYDISGRLISKCGEHQTSGYRVAPAWAKTAVENLSVLGLGIRLQQHLCAFRASWFRMAHRCISIFRALCY